MEELEDKEADVGLDPKGMRGWGHQQGRGARKGWWRLPPKQLSEQMEKDERRLRRRYLKG